MNIHEYQGKSLLQSFGIAIPNGMLALTVQDAINAAKTIGGSTWIIKAQIHAGGRGKGGGVKVANSLNEVESIAKAMLGMRLKTPQTSFEGKIVRRIYIESAADIQKEYYLSLLTDRSTQLIAFIVSNEGGMNIEELAVTYPDKIIKVLINPLIGLTDEQATQLTKSMGISQDSIFEAVDFFKKIYQCYINTDASLLEINPLNQDSKGHLMALDAKFTFDENALFRHPELIAYRDIDEEEPSEIEAKNLELSYIKLDGDIACLVNGAGLAMATMDMIKLQGGDPANFLDVGGGASPEKVTEAFKIMLKNPKVKGILVNIFGGIMKCDTIAAGIIQACKSVQLTIPLVVRMKGTNESLGQQLLLNSGLSIITADTMLEAANKIIDLVKFK